jgi:hypothetical protein
MPGIDPFSIKNTELSKREIQDRLDHYGIPDDLPIVAQVSRYDRWKDPEGVIEAFNIARKEVPATLVLLGNVATDDPEGQEVFESVLKHKEERIHILTVEDSALVNALQSRAVRGFAKIAAGRFRSDGDGGHVEGGRCDRGSLWRNQAPDPRRCEWFTRLVGRGGGPGDGANLEGRVASRETR